MADFTDEDDSLPSSPQDTEPATRYMSLLRQEIRSSPPSPNQLRKQAQLHDRAAQLRRRNAVVKQKVLEVRQRQESWESVASSQMVMQFSEANERRRRHLEQIRQRARSLRAYMRRRRDYHFEHTEASFVDEVSRYTLWEKQDSSRDEIDSNEENISLTENVESREDERNKNYSPVEVHSARILQKAIRLKILMRALRDQDARAIIEKVVDCTLSYSHAVILLTGPKSKCLSNLLTALELLTPSNFNGHSWFFYSIALISEFLEFSREVSSCAHPGFSVNVRDRNKNTLTNILLFLLYRYATRIFCQLRKLQQCPYDKIKLPLAIARLTLARYWREYHYFFLLFKFNHAQAMKEIAEEALDIAATQQRIMRSLEGKEDRSFRDRVHLFGHFSLFIGLSRHRGASWADICDKRRFCKEILTYADHLDRNLERSKKDPDLLYDVSLISDDTHQHAVVTISKGEAKYSIPPDVPTSEWRRFFFDHYREKLLSTSYFKCPSTVRSGSRSLPQVQPNFCMDDVMKLVKPQPTIISKDDPYFAQCDRRLRSLFNRYVAYCQYIGHTEDLNDTLKNYQQLSLLYDLNEIRTVANSRAQSYMKLFMLLLMQLLQYASVDDSVALAFIVEVEKGIDNILLNFEFLYRHLEATLDAKWASRCIIRDVQDFVNFENLYQMTGNNTFRDNLGTNFPQLRFRQFYQFVFMNSQCKCDARSVALAVVGGTRCGPRLLKSRMNEKASRFYSIVMVNFFSNDLHLTSSEKVAFHRVGDVQLFSLFHAQLTSLNSRFRNLFILSCLASMLQLNVGQSSMLRRTMETEHDTKAPDFTCLQSQLSEFQWNYMIQAMAQLSELKLSVVDVFTEKLRSALFTLGGPNGFFDNNCPHFASEWKILHGDIADMCMEFYGLYAPILNWIYSDLGGPSV